MELDEYRRQTLANWETMAAGWERQRAAIDEVSAPVRDWLVDALAPEPGQTILELAAGPGDTGFAAAERLGPSGRLISSDLSPAMVEVARRRGEELGLENVTYRALDAEELDLDDDSVDGVLCRFGLMLVPDPAGALAETRRVLRRGGRLALAVWRGGEHNPWITVSGRILVERGLMPRPEPGTPGIFALADDERLRELLEGAGFAVDRLEDVPVLFRFRDVDHYVAQSADTAGSFSRIWAESPDDARDSLRAELEQAFVPYTSGNGVELPGLALCVLAS